MAEEYINQDVGTKNPKRTRGRRQVSYNSESEGDREQTPDASEEEEEEPEPIRVSKIESNRPVFFLFSFVSFAQEPTRINNVRKKAVSEAYQTSEWLTEVRPRKCPYFPQMGDQLVYFPQGHHLYLEAVRVKKIYEVNSKTLPWAKLHLRVRKLTFLL